MSLSTVDNRAEWVELCCLSDLVPGSGRAALLGERQVALFYLPDEDPVLYGIDNWDPIAAANVLSRGIVGDIDGRLVVASPLYKQRFDLLTGQCLERPDRRVTVYACKIRNGRVLIQAGQ